MSEQIVKEVERFKLNRSEANLLQMALQSRDHSNAETESLFQMRLSAILLDHGIALSAVGRFVRVSETELVYLERVAEDAPSEAPEAEAPKLEIVEG